MFERFTLLFDNAVRRLLVLFNDFFELRHVAGLGGGDQRRELGHAHVSVCRCAGNVIIRGGPAETNELASEGRAVSCLSAYDRRARRVIA